MDAYNANPSSMRVSISNLRNSSADKKVLILGHMLELGESSALEHSSLLDFVNESLWEDIYIVGKEFECVNRMNVIKYFPDVLGLTDHISKDPIKGCTILLKGSRGVALERLLPYL